jgi:hypothetical protein
MGRVDPGTAWVTAVSPLEELDTAVTTLAVGAGGVWAKFGETGQLLLPRPERLRCAP